MTAEERIRRAIFHLETALGTRPRMYPLEHAGTNERAAIHRALAMCVEEIEAVRQALSVFQSSPPESQT